MKIIHLKPEIAYKIHKKESDFSIIYQKYYNEILYVITKIVIKTEIAEEVANDVFLKIRENIDKYDEKYSFKTWLYTIAINEAKTIFNKEKKKKITSCDFSSVEIGGEDIIAEARKAYFDYVTTNLEYDVEIDIKYQKIIDIIYNLNEKHKNIMIDREINRMTMEDLASKYKININTVKSRLKDGRNKVAKEYNKMLEDENKNSPKH